MTLIQARYAGTCATCGNPIRPGEDIEWQRGSPPAHAACSKTSQEPGRLVLTEEIAPDETVSEEEMNDTLLNSPPPRSARYFVQVLAGHFSATRFGGAYWGRDYLDDMDWFDIEPGPRLFGADAPDRLRAAGFEVEVFTQAAIWAAEKERIDLARIEREAKQQRATAAAEEWKATFEACTAGLVDAGALWSWSVLDRQASALTRVAYWADSMGRQVLSQGVSAVTGAPAYVHEFGNVYILYGDMATVEEAWERSWQERVERVGLVKASMHTAIFLRRYRGCTGQQAEQWAWDHHEADMRAALAGQEYPTVEREHDYCGDVAACDAFARDFGMIRVHLTALPDAQSRKIMDVCFPLVPGHPTGARRILADGTGRLYVDRRGSIEPLSEEDNRRWAETA